MSDTRGGVISLVNTQSITHPLIVETLDISRKLDARMGTLESRCIANSQQSHSPDPQSPSTTGLSVLRNRMRIGGHRTPKGRAFSQACNCSRCWGVRQFGYLKSATVAAHSGRITETQYHVEVDFVSWVTIFGQFRFLLSLQSQQQAWSLGFPSITLSKQNILPVDAPIFELSRKGDFAGIVDLFRKGSASPNDRTLDGQTPLWVSYSRAEAAAVKNHLN